MTPLQPAVLGTNKLHACSTHAARLPVCGRPPSPPRDLPTGHCWAGRLPELGLTHPPPSPSGLGVQGPQGPAHIPLPILASARWFSHPVSMVIVTPIPCCASRSLPAAKGPGTWPLGIFPCPFLGRRGQTAQQPPLPGEGPGGLAVVEAAGGPWAQPGVHRPPPISSSVPAALAALPALSRPPTRPAASPSGPDPAREQHWALSLPVCLIYCSR